MINSDRENESGFVRVYPGKLQLQYEDAFVNVPVDNSTNVSDLMRDALNRFGLQDNKIEDYRYGGLPFFFFTETNCPSNITIIS